MIAGAGEDDFRATIELMAADEGIDAVVAIFVPPLMTRAEDVALGIRAAAARCREAGKPLLAVWMAQDDAERSRLAAGEPSVPAFGAPEEAVRALAHAVRLRRMAPRDRHAPAPVLEGVDADSVAATLAEAPARAATGWLAPGGRRPRCCAATGSPGAGADRRLGDRRRADRGGAAQRRWR